MRFRSFIVSALLSLCVFGIAFAAMPEKTKDARVVKDGLMISVEYTLKNPDGKVVETSKGRGPLRYIHGQKMMIPGLERALTGMKIGDEKNVTVKPEDGYGKINPKATREIPKEKVPPNALKVGATLAATEPDGSVVPMTVKQIKEKTVVMDMNHPMAGKTLVFDVKVVDIQPAPKPPPASGSAGAPAKSASPGPPAKPGEPAKK
ncbi:MAG TPA: peptidylprolyl isomerase [Candidatus Binatia bacterium]|nr:peptidylprolyl isomerase [Candidatus Binatia bacterium]